MTPYISVGMKLRVFVPQLLMFVASIGGVTASQAAAGTMAFAPVVATTGLVGCMCLFTTIFKAVDIFSPDDWLKRLPPPREAKACKRCATLEKDNEELRHALATLGPISEKP